MRDCHARQKPLFLQPGCRHLQVTDDGGGYALHSWVDESMHVDGDNGLYILAAVVCEVGSCDPIRDALRGLLDEGQPKLHWGAESPERKGKIIGAVAQIDMAAVVVIGVRRWRRRSRNVPGRYAWRAWSCTWPRWTSPTSCWKSGPRV